MGINDFPYQNIRAATAQLEKQGFTVNWSPDPAAPTVRLIRGDDRYTLKANDLINLYLSGRLDEPGLSRYKDGPAQSQ
jgi:hypothetical protein